MDGQSKIRYLTYFKALDPIPSTLDVCLIVEKIPLTQTYENVIKQMVLLVRINSHLYTYILSNYREKKVCKNKFFNLFSSSFFSLLRYSYNFFLTKFFYSLLLVCVQFSVYFLFSVSLTFISLSFVRVERKKNSLKSLLSQYIFCA